MSIANHEVYLFSYSFQHIKNLKIHISLIGQIHFAYNLRTRFCRNKVFGRITKATMVHHFRPKIAHINRTAFCKIYIADLFQSTFR